MKNFKIFGLLSFIILFTSINLFAQVPQAFKYQSIVRNDVGNPMANESISVRATIHDGSENGPSVYQETHSVNTNQFGLINLEIGTGTIESGTFPSIEWGIGTKWMQIEADFGAGYISMGTSQLLSVPYALYCPTGTPGSTGIMGATGMPGLTGSTGIQGITGAGLQGIAGVTGATGLQGIAGQSGSTGSTGLIGISGVSGSSGNTGLTGITGISGSTGSTGFTGISGLSGSTGNTGFTGVSGTSGSSGNTGLTGESGTSGSTGNTGLTGVTGASGSTGLTGVSGASGNTGYTGETGFSGVSGNTGLTGLTGVSGASGNTGLTGVSGSTGNTGFTGVSGSSGLTGSTGVSGTSGLTGLTGSSGATGLAGNLANNYAEFYALMPSDNVATIAVGSAIEFPQNGPSDAVIIRINASTFQLTNVGTYQVFFQVSVAEAGQLVLGLDDGLGMVEIAKSVVGRATGTTQLVGMTFLTTTSPNAILSVRNPTGNSTALTLTPTAGGTHDVAATLIIMKIR